MRSLCSGRQHVYSRRIGTYPFEGVLTSLSCPCTMKLQTLLPSLLAVAGLANAQYFSAGWAPGQPIPTQSSPPPQTQPHPVNPAVTVSNFFDTLLTGGAVSALASLVGLNVSAPQEIDWDDRIPLITDSNYEDVIVRESMTPEEEKQRVWFLVMYVCPPNLNGLCVHSSTAQSLLDSRTACPST